MNVLRSVRGHPALTRAAHRASGADDAKPDVLPAADETPPAALRTGRAAVSSC